jgi:hypothetical protein
VIPDRCCCDRSQPAKLWSPRRATGPHPFPRSGRHVPDSLPARPSRFPDSLCSSEKLAEIRPAGNRELRRP